MSSESPKGDAGTDRSLKRKNDNIEEEVTDCFKKNLGVKSAKSKL